MSESSVLFHSEEKSKISIRCNKAQNTIIQRICNLNNTKRFQQTQISTFPFNKLFHVEQSRALYPASRSGPSPNLHQGPHQSRQQAIRIEPVLQVTLNRSRGPSTKQHRITVRACIPCFRC